MRIELGGSTANIENSARSLEKIFGLGKDCRYFKRQRATTHPRLQHRLEDSLNDKGQAGLFITGTNTEVGKTYVTALLAARLRQTGLSVGVYKPVASGCIRRAGELVSEDAEALWRAAGQPETLAEVTPQCFEAPLAPNVAAKQAGKQVDAQLLRTGLDAWKGYPCLLVEGVGGILAPMSDEDLVADLACEFAFPLIIVAANELGCINHTLLTIALAQSRGLTIAGIILNATSPDGDASCESNHRELARLSNVPILASVGYQATTLSLEGLQAWLPK